MKIIGTPPTIYEKLTLKNSQEAELAITKEAMTAIEHNWESLYFANNSTVFGIVETDSHFFILTTCGEVRIVDTKDGHLLVNRDEKEIAGLFENFDSERYVINDNNWFAIVVYEKDNNGTFYGVTDILFEDEPESLEELKDELIASVNYYLED